MRNSLKIAVVFWLIYVGLSSTYASDLQTYKAAHQKREAEISQEFQPQFADIRDRYRQALEKLKAIAQDKGDLEKVTAAMQEIERFEKSNTHPPLPIMDGISDIMALQNTYVRLSSRLEAEMVARLGALAEKYNQALERLQVESVRANRLNEATLIQQERTKVKEALNGYAARMAELREAAKNVTPAPASGSARTREDEIPAPTGSVRRVVEQEQCVPRSMRGLNGSWKIVKDGPDGKDAKGFVYFYVDHGRAPWDGWSYDAKQKLWRVAFKRDGWANDRFVFDGMDGPALTGKFYPAGEPVFMVPIDPTTIALPKDVAELDGFWSYSGVGWSDLVLEFKKGRTVDGCYTFRLAHKEKVLEMTEKATKTTICFLPVEEGVWMGMNLASGWSQVPKVLRKK